MENPCQSHVCKKFSRAKFFALAALQGKQGRAKEINSPCRAALPCDSLCFVVSFYKKALRKSQKQLRICRFSMNMTLIDRLQLQTFDIIFVELNQSLIHITV
jgi:hypothetical protein